MRRSIMLFGWLFTLLLLPSCFRARNLASEKAETLPKVEAIGVPSAPADQRPIVKTQDGYVVSSIPGVPVAEPEPYEYTTYVGPSN